MLDSITSYPAFCLAVLLFLALPGPGTLTLLSSTASGGLRAGVAATWGVILGDQLLLWCAVGGVAALLSAQPMAFMVLQAAGAAYLVCLGFGLLRAQASATPHTTPPTQNHLRKAFLITVLNPKAIFFYLAFFPQFIKSPVPHPLTTFATLAGTVAVITAIYCTSLCAFAAHVSHRFGGNQSAAVWLQRALGVGLIAFGVSLFRLERLPL